MSEVKRVSVNAVDAVMKGYFNNTEEFEWYGNRVVVRKVLPIRVMMDFVRQVAESCFDDNDYLPEMKDFIIRASVIERYTNVTLPKNSEKMYDMLYGCDLFDNVVALVDDKQFAIILDAIDDKIAYMQESRVNAITSLLIDMKELVDGFKEAGSKFDADTIVSGMQALAEQNVSPERMLREYIKIKEEQAAQRKDETKAE